MKVARGQDRVEVMSLIDVVLVKKDLLHYVQNMRVVRGMGHEVSHIILLYCVKLGWWVLGLRREMVTGVGRIRSEKLMEYQYI